MTKFLDIAVKNLKTIFRDKKGTLFLILIPVMFYSLMGFVFGGQDSNEAQVYAYKVGYVDMDTSTSNHPTKNVPFLVEKINDTETVDLFMYEDNNSAFQALQQKEVDAYFIIPGGFELFINGTNSSLQENITFYFRGSTSEIAKSIIVSTVIGVIEGVVNYDPLDIRVPFEETTTAGENLNTLTLGTPGYLMYGVLSGLASAVILLTMERKQGLLKRLETSRMKPSDMLLGHVISNTTVVFIQFGVGLVVLSLFGFRPVMIDPASLVLGTGMTILLLSFFQNALALVAATLFKTPESSAGGVWLILIPLMAFSGAFFPLELVTPEIVPYVGWLPTRMTVLLLQDFLLNGVSIAAVDVLLKFLWIGLETLLVFLVGLKLYSQFAKS